jgi:hypothetical protein
VLVGQLEITREEEMSLTLISFIDFEDERAILPGSVCALMSQEL